MGTTEAEVQRPSLWKTILEWALLVAAAFIVARLITAFIVQPFAVPTGSMIPAVQPGDRVIVAKYQYSLGEPQRGDVVVFGNWVAGEPDLLKRIVALPGETISMDAEGRFTIDGKVLEEPYLDEAARKTTAGVTRFPVTLKADQYWVMGDNRNNSGDSRFNGPITRQQLVGKALFVFWPLTDMRGL
jgi:signal peptidase I